MQVDNARNWWMLELLIYRGNVTSDMIGCARMAYAIIDGSILHGGLAFNIIQNQVFKNRPNFRSRVGWIEALVFCFFVFAEWPYRLQA
jgi:hypothetical protein